MLAAPSASAGTSVRARSSRPEVSGSPDLSRYFASSPRAGSRPLERALLTALVAGVTGSLRDSTSSAFDGWALSGGGSLRVVIDEVSARSLPALRHDVRSALSGACNALTGAPPVSETGESEIQGAEIATCAASTAGSLGAGASAGTPTTQAAVGWSRGDVVVTVAGTGLSRAELVAGAEEENDVVPPTGVPTGEGAPYVVAVLAGCALILVIVVLLAIVRFRPDRAATP